MALMVFPKNSGRISHENPVSGGGKLGRETQSLATKIAPYSVPMAALGAGVPLLDSPSWATKPVTELPSPLYFVCLENAPSMPAVDTPHCSGSSGLPISRKLAAGTDSGLNRLEYHR